MMSEKRIDIDVRLASERHWLLAIEASLAGEHDAVIDASTDANLDDEHDPEGSTVGFERARVASLLRSVRHRLSDLAEAVERVHGGTYGRCQGCGAPIDSERLAAYPTAAACRSCAGVRSDHVGSRPTPPSLGREPSR